MLVSFSLLSHPSYLFLASITTFKGSGIIATRLVSSEENYKENIKVFNLTEGVSGLG